MADAKTGKKTQEVGPDASEPTPLEKMTSLTRRVLAVPKSEAVRGKPKKRKRSKPGG